MITRRLALGLIPLLLAVYVGWTLLRPLPALQPSYSASQPIVATPASQLNWPVNTQAAVAVAGTTILETHGQQKPSPTASVAKVITALTVLKKYPLQPSQTGPIIILTANDVAIYNTYVAQEGSVTPVQAGEQISEYQMLQAMMLPSANNMADSLAIWAYGSLPAYSKAANSYVQSLGLHDTTVGSDASGLSPDTVSTAHDLVKLGQAAMADPVLSQIVSQSSATGIPLTSSVNNVNFLLGNSGIVGIKTGNSDQAGGVFLSASKTTVNNKAVTIITALVNAPNLFFAVQGSLPLIQSAQTNFSNTPLIRSGAVVGHYQQPGGQQLDAVTKADITDTTWRGSRTSATVKLQPAPKTGTKGQIVGSVSAPKTPFSSATTSPVVLADPARPPSLIWRLLHPIN